MALAGSPGIPSALGPPSSVGPRQAQMAPSAGAKDRRLLPAPRRTVPFPAPPSRQGGCSPPARMPTGARTVPWHARKPSKPRCCSAVSRPGPHCPCPCSFAFSRREKFPERVLCSGNAVIQREVSRGREGSLPSSVEGLENGLSQEMEGGQDIPWGFLQRSGFVFINSRT